MNLDDLQKPVDSNRVADLIKSQFDKKYDISKLTMTEARKLIKKTDQMIYEFKTQNNYHDSHNNASYMKLLMLKEAAEKRAKELTNLQESNMNKKLASALKIAAQGGTLTENQLEDLKVSETMKSVLRHKKTAQDFMHRIVESRKAKKALNEGEIDQAQTTIAAQDIADQMQDMIEKFADIKYKELPALHDSIRNAQGVDAAEEFKSTVSNSLDELTSSLEQAKGEVNNAIAVLTGQEEAGDLNLDDMEIDAEGGDGLDMDMDLDSEEDDLGDEEDIDIDLDLDDEEEVDLGRERRE